MNKAYELIQKSTPLELELLNVLFADTRLLTRVRQLINSTDFYTYRYEYECIVDCFENEKNILVEFTTKNLRSLDVLRVPSVRPIEKIARQLHDVSNGIKIYKLLETSLASVPTEKTTEFITDLQKKIFGSVTIEQDQIVDIQILIDEFKRRQEEYIQKFKTGAGIIGISTGYDKLDNLIDGLRPEHLWVLGGYTNMGKTSASLNIVANLIKQGKRVVYYSLEMGRIDILTRLLGILTNESGLKILKGYPHDNASVVDAFNIITKSKLTIFDNKYNLDEIIYSMLDQNQEHVDLFVLDFIQNVKVTSSHSEYEKTTDVIISLQEMAKRLKSTIMVLSQISNEGARNSDEVVMSFKGSGAIAAAADLAIEITIGEEDKKSWKEKMHLGEHVKMKWNVRKNRHGQVGYIDMDFKGKTGLFTQHIESIF